MLYTINELFNQDRMGVHDDKKIISICDYILDGNLVVLYNRIPEEFTYERELKYDIENFNWDLTYQQTPSLCQLHLQGFTPIKYLIQGYSLTSNENYLDLASKLIQSWLKYEPISKNRFIWFKDIGPDRSIVMIYFSLISKMNNISKYKELIQKIDYSLKKHAEFFYDDSNYRLNNHGTMIDKALYIISLYLDNTSLRYRKKAITRLRDALKRNFSDKMVNLESSIAYHLFSMELFMSIEKSLLSRFNDSCGINQSSIENFVNFLIYSTKPDLYFPIIGDGHKQDIASLRYYSFYSYIEKNPLLKYLLTRGKSGHKPNKLFKVYQKEGFAFIRNSWDGKASYISFISGSGNPDFVSHKHADDLSFTYFTKGKDIFIDSGTYTYEQGAMRSYFISALAHNTIVVDEKNYPIQLWTGSFISKQFEQDIHQKWGNIEDTGILDYGEKEYCYVVGKNDMYEGVNLTRSLYFLKSGAIILIDNIQSHKPHKYSQYYHLNPKIIPQNIDVKLENNKTKVIISTEDINIYITQIGLCNFRIFNGNKNEARPGISSEKPGDLEETKTLQFSLESKNAKFITLISVTNKNDPPKCNIKTSTNISDELIVNENGNEIKIPLYNHSRNL